MYYDVCHTIVTHFGRAVNKIEIEIENLQDKPHNQSNVKHISIMYIVQWYDMIFCKK